jgi:ATP-dependent 26S proteasome regulatory subunit
MTTNKIERLDPALIRGGRVDRRFDFSEPNEAQFGDLFLSFYPDAGRELAERFVAKVMSGPKAAEARAISTLQQHFISVRKASALECVEALDRFYDTYSPGGFLGTFNAFYS